MGTRLNCSNVMSAFSALHLLRSYNQFLGPADPIYQPLLPPERLPSSTETSFCFPATTCNSPPFPGYSPLKNQVGLCSRSSLNIRRQRGEKKPIPEEQKDERYFERRKRNNQAAKKSRDARRFREDQIAIRAMQLEHENAVLTAQNITLREEVETLRQLLLHRKKL